MRILVCEPDRLFAEALAAVLAARGHDVATAVPVIDLDGAAAGWSADVVVVATSADDLAAATAAARASAPHADLVVVADVPSKGDAAVLLASRARACVPTTAPLSELVAVIEGGEPLRRPAGWASSRSAPHERWLTAREIETLEGLVDGCTTETLSALLGVSTATARTHVQNLMMKLGAHSRIEAVAIGLREGIVRVDRERVS